MLRSILVLIAVIGVPNSLAYETDTNIIELTTQISEQKWEAEKKLLNVHFVPDNPVVRPAQNVRAKAAFVVDPKSAFVYHEKNAHTKLPIASLTKIMTAIIVLEENNLNDKVLIEFNPDLIEGRKMGLYQYERITVKNLLLGLIIHSANDAAFALAVHNAGSMTAFVEKMNQKAEILGLKNTNFSNSIGFDDPNDYSTARELSLLSMYALKKPLFRKMAGIASLSVYSDTGLEHRIETTNKLLQASYLNILGLKTGTTDEAGECFIGLIETKKGNEVLVVLLNSPNRFQEMKGLSEIVLNNNSI